MRKERKAVEGQEDVHASRRTRVVFCGGPFRTEMVTLRSVVFAHCISQSVPAVRVSPERGERTLKSPARGVISAPKDAGRSATRTETRLKCE